ncbi:MAG TPA: folylpolyglutamate synthase/dihydrofolate synthase family protein [Geopsychrobacteraceae bacterium]|nr:folylpolyglutamate synthase/dihydrofolate synthase family protein [Geopsychrobacteraceae bacterium]
MGYQASLDYLYSLQRFGIKLGLENTALLLKRLGNPQDALRIVHVAGTNGKGSTASALASILCQAGLRTGLYTSPHLHSFTERIQINGKPIEEQSVAALIEEIKPVAEDLGTTFFEFATALALLSFQRNGVEWVVLEVGMGGRLDATNIVSPELVLLSPISLDHAEHLGDSLAAVAGEKAGIFKQQVPVLSARQPEAAARVVEKKALTLEAPLFRSGTDFTWRASADRFNYHGLDRTLSDLTPGLTGTHQLENLSLALAAAELLKRSGVKISTSAMREGIAQVVWPGRLEWLSGHVLLDGAHNPAGAEVLGAYLKTKSLDGIHWIVGLKADKDSEKILTPLLPFTKQLYACKPPVEAAVSPHSLAALARKAGVSAEVFELPQQALAAAQNTRKAEELILVAGSLFLVAEIREQLFSTVAHPDGLKNACWTGTAT